MNDYISQAFSKRDQEHTYESVASQIPPRTRSHDDHDQGLILTYKSQISMVGWRRPNWLDIYQEQKNSPLLLDALRIFTAIMRPSSSFPLYTTPYPPFPTFSFNELVNFFTSE
jgi:hypothetical protein